MNCSLKYCETTFFIIDDAMCRRQNFKEFNDPSAWIVGWQQMT